MLPCAVRPVALAAEESQQQLGRLALVPLQHLADALPPPDRLAHNLVCTNIRPKLYERLHISTEVSCLRSLCLVPDMPCLD